MLFVLPILTQLVRVVFAINIDWPPCIDNSCDYMTQCLYHSECTAIYPSCSVYGDDICSSLGNFECKRVSIFGENQCTEKNLKCNSSKDCSPLFQCKNSYCLPALTCYDSCNVFSKCSDSTCKMWVHTNSVYKLLQFKVTKFNFQ